MSRTLGMPKSHSLLLFVYYLCIFIVQQKKKQPATFTDVTTALPARFQLKSGSTWSLFSIPVWSLAT